MTAPATNSPSLGIEGSNSASNRETMLQRRHRLRRRAGQIAGSIVATRDCGRRSVSADGSVQVWQGAGGGVQVRSVRTCGSIWACPVCAQKIAAKRCDELAELLAKHGEAGGGAALLTLTVPHQAGQRLRDVRAMVLDAWAKLTGSGWWRRTVKGDFRVAGFVRAVEITHGRNGWHPHIHALLCIDGGGLDPSELAALRLGLLEQWTRFIRGDRVNRRGDIVEEGDGPTPDPEHGIDLVAADCGSGTVARYVAKWGAGQELSGHAAKRGRKGNRTPFQLLEDADRGDRMAASLFRHYVKTTKGTRHLGVSPVLRQRYQWRDQDDADAAASQPDLPGINGEGETLGLVGIVDGGTWREICARDLTADFIQTVRDRTFDGAVSWLAETYGLSIHGMTSARFMASGRRQPTPDDEAAARRRIADHRWRECVSMDAEARASLRAAIIERAAA